MKYLAVPAPAMKCRVCGKPACRVVRTFDINTPRADRPLHPYCFDHGGRAGGGGIAQDDIFPLVEVEVK